VSEYSSNDRYNRDVETTVFQYVAAMLFLWLLAGFWQLQVRNPEEYEARAANNSVKSLPIVAPRGKIFDRDGRLIVDNAPAFSVLLSGQDVDREALQFAADGLTLTPEQVEERLEDLRRSNYQQTVLKENLTQAEVAFLEAHKSQLPDLEIIRSQRRLYPREGLAAHVVGYVGEISERELQLDEFALVERGAEIGKAGIERQYNDVLSGENGRRLVMVDSRSRRVRDLDVVPATPGRNLQLTIDLDVQAVAELAMEGRRGSIVALDPHTGEVLAMVSAPSYDPNRFVGGIAAKTWKSYVEDPDKPMLNRSIQAQLAPGSIFKPIMGLAALSTGVVNRSFQVHCGGGQSFYGRFFRCHRSAGHGWVDLEKALVESCDVYFYTVGKELGVDRIAEFAELAGFGKRTGIDLPNEQEGIVPSVGWKARRYLDRWWPGETISVSIGQGALTVTPLQAAYSIAGLATGGAWHRPHLLSHDDRRALTEDYQAPDPELFEISNRTLSPIVRGMWGVVNDGGTGARARLDGYDICGKTGSAQRVSRSFAATNTNDRLLDDGWFVAFAPCREPKIVVATLWENGEHGSLASPMVRDVIKAYLDKQRRVEWANRRPAPADRPDSPAAPAIDRPTFAATEEVSP